MEERNAFSDGIESNEEQSKNVNEHTACNKVKAIGSPLTPRGTPKDIIVGGGFSLDDDDDDDEDSHHNKKSNTTA